MRAFWKGVLFQTRGKAERRNHRKSKESKSEVEAWTRQRCIDIPGREPWATASSWSFREAKLVVHVAESGMESVSKQSSYGWMERKSEARPLKVCFWSLDFNSKPCRIIGKKLRREGHKHIFTLKRCLW